MRKVLSFFIMLLSLVQTKAQDYAENHVIIALDARSNLMKDNWSTNVEIVSKKLPLLLENNGIESGLVSTMTYSIDSNENDFSKYTQKEAVVEDFTIQDIANYWRTLSRTIKPGDPKFSLLSIAKPYCLKAVMVDPKDDSVKLTYRTFLILITDLKYNGIDDFHDELRHKPGMNQSLLNKILGNVKVVQQNYYYDFISQDTLNRGYMILFECIPQQKYFALESVANYPHNIIAKRKKDGYSLELELKSYDNPNYNLLKSEIKIGNETALVQGYGKVRFLVPSHIWEEGDTIHANIKSWVRLLDGIYNRTILSPDGAELQGRDGLNKTIVVQREPYARILWIVPLPDFLFQISFWTSDQAIAAGVWSVLILFVIVAFIIYLIGKTMKYDPKKQDPTMYNV